MQYKEKVKLLLIYYLIIFLINIGFKIKFKIMLIFSLTIFLLGLLTFIILLIIKFNKYILCIYIPLLYFLPQVIYGEIIAIIMKKKFIDINVFFIKGSFLLLFVLIIYSFYIVFRKILNYYNLPIRKTFIILIPIILYALLSESVIISIIIKYI